MQPGVRPINYELEFEPDLRRARFSGRARIRFLCERPVSSLRLDAAELEITRAAVGARAAAPRRAAVSADAGAERLDVDLGGAVRGEAALELEFAGTLNDRLLGFYRSTYTSGGRTSHLATTQFEAADARRAFPCWDEPAAKATFDVSIVARDGLQAISNMPVRSRKRLPGGRIRHSFATTPPMSTYLVYLGVGDFEFLTGRQDGVTVRVATVPGSREKGRYALGEAKRLLGMYGKYFGIPYPLPKLDLIAIPDFAAGAMENWGAITFREALLLYDPKNSSTRTKQYISEVVSHEIAHQWFGNLVTMKWWNDLWLNESFATFMATKFVHAAHPEWEMWEQFTQEAANAAMSLDALRSSHPIDVKVGSPAEIREIFDAISYDKGGCILRMLEDHVTEAAFRRGLRRYLKEFAYGNASGSDLWEAIGRAARLPVAALVGAWLRKAGFPLLEARGSAAAGGARTVRLSQKRFLALGGRGGGGGKWPIPVSFGLAGGGGRGPRKGGRLLLEGRTGAARLEGAGSGFVANSGRRGFYRVRYDQGALLDIRHAVSRMAIPAADRWGVQNDMHALCIAGLEPLRAYLELADAYGDEESYMVNADLSANLASLWLRTYGEPCAGLVAGRAARHFGRLLGRLGWDAKRGERHSDALLRGPAISALGRLGDAGVAAEASRRLGAYLDGAGPLAADLREPVYSAAAWNAGGRGSALHRKMVAAYKRAGSQEEKARILGGGLCSFRDEGLLRRTLEFALGHHVRSQNVHVPIVRAAANPLGRGILWPWLKSNWRAVSSKAGRGNPLLARIVSSLSAAAGEDSRRDIEGFFAENPAPGTERALRQALERIRINHAFLERARRETA